MSNPINKIVAGFIAMLIVGTGITIALQPHVFGELPANQWSSILSWIGAAIVGYVAAMVVWMGTVITFIRDMFENF